jgi:hypothetical protein
MIAAGAADQIQRVAHQALGDVARPFEQAANLQVDAAAQLSGIGIGRQRPSPRAVRKAVATHQKARAEGTSWIASMRLTASSISGTPAPSLGARNQASRPRWKWARCCRRRLLKLRCEPG